MMCNPTVAAAIPMIISTATQMTAQAQEAKYENRQLNRQAKVAQAQGLENERRLRTEAARDQAKRRVAILKGGVTTEGSPTDLLVDAAREDDVAARWARFGQTETARNQEREARYRRRRSMLDQLSSTNALGANLISLKEDWS